VNRKHGLQSTKPTLACQYPADSRHVEGALWRLGKWS
jgi:hypothetical protein